jgi:hypothetical protein
MKKLLITTAVFGSIFFLNACYTVVQGDYHYTDNSQDTIIIVENPIPPPPPPLPPVNHPIRDPYIPPHTPVNPPTKERIDPPKRNSGSSTDNDSRNTGGRDTGGRNGKSR